MKTNDQIAEMFQKNRLSDVRYACIERLNHDRLDGQAWIYLGHALIGLKRGKMAHLCFRRALLFDAYATWQSEMESAIQNTEQGHDDNQIQQLLEVPHTTISACVLTRDSSRTIRQCIEALQGAVDEIIVVDTGSKDDTVSIVESLGVKVHYFEWIEDFSAARNFALSLVTSEWVISVDSDEILYGEDRDSLRIVAGMLNDKPFLLKVLLMNRANGTIEQFSIARMFKASDFEWTHPIHEQINWKTAESSKDILTTTNVRIRFFHDGHDSSVVNINEKSNRNIDILRKTISTNPGSPDNYFYLGRDLSSIQQNEEAVGYLEKAYELGKKIERYSMLPEICITLYNSYCALGLLDDAKSAAQHLTQDCPEHPDGWFNYAMATANYTSDIQEIFDLFTMAKQTGSIYRGPANFDPEIGTWKANYMLGQLSQAQGRLQIAQTLFREVLKVVPNHEDTTNRLREIERQLS